MTERQMQVRIGALVLVGILVFFAFVLSIGKRSTLFEERYSLWASFSSSEGLAVGSPVRLAGVSVGNVTRISFGRDPRDRRIVVTLTAERRVQERIREDSVASIGTIGLVGDKVLDITVGSHDRPALPPGGQLASTDPPDYVQLLQKGDRILDHVTRISASLEDLLAGGEQAGKKSLSEGLRSLRNTLVQVEKGEGLLHDLIYGREGREILGRADRSLQALERVSQAIEKERGLLHALIYATPEETLGRFTRTADTVTRLAEGAEALVREAREGKGLLHALLYDPDGTEILARLGRSSERLDDLVRAIREGQGLVPALLFDPERAKLLDDVQATAAGLKAVTTDLAAIAARLHEGEGTVGGLLEDPTIYEDLSALLRGANRSTLLRSLIRSTRDSGAQPAR